MKFNNFIFLELEILIYPEICLVIKYIYKFLDDDYRQPKPKP